MGNQENIFSNGLEFREYFIEELSDINGAEKQFHQALRNLSSATSDDHLAHVLDRYAVDIKRNMSTLEVIFGMMDEKVRMKTCRAMEGMIREAEEVVSETGKDSFTRDAALILAAQRAGHYCIATYATLMIFAGHMGEVGVRRELEDILINHKQADVKLTAIAENYINALAAAE